ncbi:MAG: hypothetical protein EBS05_05925 [Proteobacteria bacterium]|nr:hypothetical protein [Pseudomonadota bacterium]
MFVEGVDGTEAGQQVVVGLVLEGRVSLSSVPRAKWELKLMVVVDVDGDGDEVEPEFCLHGGDKWR